MAAATAVSADALRSKLESALQATSVTVLDTSGGCGAAFDVAVVSPLFEGKMLIARHRMVHDAIKEDMGGIHALSIKAAWTPAQQQQQAAPAGGGA
ncbi:MAG: bola protein [Monoraphidium minutum]|nr:MAG: bola protein [Monoraphidium minutum]